jgi:DNA-binding NarL/FixJ family response regulator
VTKTIKVIVAEEQEILLKGISQALSEIKEIKIIAAVASWEELVGLIKAGYKPEVLLFNVSLPQVDLTKIKEIKIELPETKFIALTRPEGLIIQQLIDIGIVSFLAPGFDNQQLIRAIQISARGEVFLHPHVAKKLLERQTKLLGQLKAGTKDLALLNKLTTREKEVAALIAQGYSNNEIGSLLFISPKTVRSHAKNILDKLEYKHRVQVALFALRTGLINLWENPNE